MARNAPSRLLAGLLILSLVLPNLAFASTNQCELRPSFSDVAKQVENIDNASCRAAQQSLFESERNSGGSITGVLWSSARCLEGIGLGVKDYVMAIPHMVELIWEGLPAVQTMGQDILRNANNDSASPIERAGNVAIANFKIAKFMYKLAKESYTHLKDGLHNVMDLLAHWFKKEWREFFCLPPSIQSKVICKLIFDVMPIIMSPTILINKSEWAQIILKELAVAKKVSTALGATPVTRIISRFSGEHDKLEGIREAVVKLGSVARKEHDAEMKIARAMSEEVSTTGEVSVATEAGTTSTRRQRR